MDIVGIIQTRTGSTRLPNKVSMFLLGKPMIYHVMERAQRAKLLNNVILATTTLTADDSLIDLCNCYHWDYFRHISANFQDLTGLYYATAKHYKADVIVRLTSDNPLIDPDIIDLVIEKFLDMYPHVDYIGNCELPLTYPIGIAVEVFTLNALEEVWVECQDLSWREHATLPIRKQPDKFKIVPVYNKENYSDRCWTVDTMEDFKFVEKVFNFYGHNRFTMEDIIKDGL